MKHNFVIFDGNVYNIPIYKVNDLVMFKNHLAKVVYANPYSVFGTYYNIQLLNGFVVTIDISNVTQLSDISLFDIHGMED